ncbi:MAG: DinB family protein [Chloroflexi bacterium]|nr:DinB family protein [Chloroflexota bacterium]
MLVEYAYFRRYLFTALESAPGLFTVLLDKLTGAEADRRPDPDRFTLREVMAHLADWELIFLQRMERVCTEDFPEIPGIDEGQRAIDQGYGSTDPLEQLELFRERREQTVQYLRDRSPEEWQRSGNRREIGVLTLESLATLLPLHDMYHLDQAAEWRKQ